MHCTICEHVVPVLVVWHVPLEQFWPVPQCDERVHWTHWRFVLQCVRPVA